MEFVKDLFGKKDIIVTDLSILQQISYQTSFEECDSIQLFDRLKKTNKTGWTKSYGLAACQIGVLLSAFYYEQSGKIIEVVNPEILEKKGLFIAQSEGCLSFPNQRIDTYRYKSIIVTDDFRITKDNETQIYLNQKFSLDDLEAHIFSHEFDHTLGKTIFDCRAKIAETFKRSSEKIGRNSLCPCQSGKKYKHCCIDIYEAQEGMNTIESKI